MIMAYYLTDNGMADFERESYNLRQELNRLQELIKVPLTPVEIGYLAW